MRFLCVTYAFSGIKDYLEGSDQPKGQPAFYKFLEGAWARGHEVHVVFDSDKAITRSVENKASFYGVPVGKSARSGKGFFKAVIQTVLFARQIGKEHEFDLVYGHGPYGGVCCWALHKLWRVPYVVRHYGSNLYGRYGSNRARMLREFPAVLSFALPAMYLVITQDGTQADKVARLFGVPEERLKVWFNGFERQVKLAESSVEWPVPLKSQSLLWVSRLVGWKHPERALTLFRQLIPRYPELHLVYVGEGNLEAELKKEVEKEGLTKQVHFVGGISHEDVLTFFPKATLFLSFFDHSNLGNSLIEAMAAGCCIVALDEGDTSLVIKNGETGFLVEKSDDEKLMGIVIQLLNEPRLRARIGRNAQAFVNECLPTWEERIDWEIDLLESVASRQ